MSSLPPPPPAKPRNESLAASIPSYRNRPEGHGHGKDGSSFGEGFSFANTRSMFESLNTAETRNNVMKFLKNPTVQRTAVAAAKNEQVRNAAISVAQNPKAREFAIETAKDPQSRGTILSMAKTFENKPVMGFATSPVNEPHTSPFVATQNLNIAPISSYQPPQPMYPNLTGDSSWNNRSSYNSSAPSYPERSQSTDPELNAMVDELFPTGALTSNLDQTTEPHAIVKYPYNSGQPDELNCEVNDTVLLKNEVDDQWIYAMNVRTGRSGIVPISYLSIKIPLVPTPGDPYPMPTFGSTAPSYNNNRISMSQSTYTGFLDNHKIIARGLYDYDTGVEGDLKFQAGDIINVIERVSAEWLRGDANGRRGIFPLNYVECQDINSVPMAKSSGTGNPLADSMAKLSFKPKFVTALYNYYSGVPDDLVFEAGDVIQVVEELDDQWVKGYLDGRTGLVPLTYVERNLFD
uniref:SH3 domain-containing protein n=1 Tax=Panagrellus redivivus TaxID=6233 RepID=A0A7E4ZRK4_PANRE